MKPIRVALQLLAEGNRSVRQIAKACAISRQAVEDYRFRATQAGVAWPLPKELDDFALEAKLFPVRTAVERCHFPQPDWDNVLLEMKKKGATLRVLHEEYLQQHPEGMKYVRFCQRFRSYKKSLRTSMRFDYQAGEIAFVDYAGPTVTIHNLRDGTKATAQIFVGVLGASSLIFAEATWSQKLENWLDSHTRMYEAFGGTPRIVVCDNLKSAVLRPHRNEPEVHPAYLEHGRHHGVQIVPARAYHPKDKARAERSVQIVERWILFRLRKCIFTSLVELNTAIRELLVQVNGAPMRRIHKSRQELFDTIERPALRPLPAIRYVYFEESLVRVGIDYYVLFQDHEYSVPHTLRGQQVKLRATATAIEIYFKGRRQTCHERKYEPGRTTLDAHRSAEHAAYLDWNMAEALNRAAVIGTHAHQFLVMLCAQVRHLDHQRRADKALQNLAQEFATERVNRACARAIECARIETQFVRELLRNRREDFPAKPANDTPAVMEHENLRDGKQFDQYLNEEPKKCRSNKP